MAFGTDILDGQVALKLTVRTKTFKYEIGNVDFTLDPYSFRGHILSQRLDKI